MQIASALRTDRICKALTGLTVHEFESFVTDFEIYYKEYEAKRKKKRKRKVGGGRDSKIETIKEKCFYILWYKDTLTIRDRFRYNASVFDKGFVIAIRQLAEKQP